VNRTALRAWFVLAVAWIAAAAADCLVEGLSNAGFFGPGSYTDHSNLDVLPTLIAGAAFVALHLALRVRAAFDPAAPSLLRAGSAALSSGFARLLPAIFALQIVTLFAMESTEQRIVAGHLLGGTVWLGGPVLAALAIHAVICAIAAFSLAGAIRLCARTAVRIIVLLRAVVVPRAHAALSPFHYRSRGMALRRPAPVLCRIGERAPPYATRPA